MDGYNYITLPDQNEINFSQFIWLWNRSQALSTPRLHFEIANWLNQRWLVGDRKLLLLCFRSAGKSTLIGLFCAWLLFKYPNLRILVLSAEFELAKKMVRNVKSIVERHPLTNNLVPDRSVQWTADQFTVRRSVTLRDPSLLARGIGSNITGSRADIVISDDVEVPNTCQTQRKGEELRERLNEVNYVLIPGGLLLYAGTPHCTHSIYSELPGDSEERPFLEGFSRLVMPILNAKNESCWPERFPISRINELRERTGPAKFSSQMMLEPIRDDELRLDPSRLLRYDNEIQYRESNGEALLYISGRKMVSVTAWWDPSFGSPTIGDASVVAAVFVDEDGGYWLHDIRYLEHDPAERENVDEATQLCRQVVDFVNCLFLPSITVETNGLGRFLPSILQREINIAGKSCAVLEHASRKSKDHRILSAFDPVMAAEALHVHTQVWQTPFINEMRDWRPGRNGRDDGLDAVSGCILNEPVRLRRSMTRHGRSWRNQSIEHAIESDFVP